MIDFCTHIYPHFRKSAQKIGWFRTKQATGKQRQLPQGPLGAIDCWIQSLDTTSWRRTGQCHFQRFASFDRGRFHSSEYWAWLCKSSPTPTSVPLTSIDLHWVGNELQCEEFWRGYSEHEIYEEIQNIRTHFILYCLKDIIIISAKNIRKLIG